MFGDLNPKKMQALMKQLGMSQEEIPAIRVIIEREGGGKLVIENPSVSKISIQGQESFQILGSVREDDADLISEEDVRTVMEKTGSTKQEARRALKDSGNDLVEAILRLSNSKEQQKRE